MFGYFVLELVVLSRSLELTVVAFKYIEDKVVKAGEELLIQQIRELCELSRVLWIQTVLQVSDYLLWDLDIPLSGLGSDIVID